MKFLPSECELTPLLGHCLAKQTPRTASGMSSDSNNSYVCGKTAQFATFQFPNRCKRKADHPSPMMADCHAESPENKVLPLLLMLEDSSSDGDNKFCWNSFIMMWALSCNSFAHGKFFGSDSTSQNGCSHHVHVIINALSFKNIIPKEYKCNIVEIQKTPVLYIFNKKGIHLGSQTLHMLFARLVTNHTTHSTYSRFGTFAKIPNSIQRLVLVGVKLFNGL